MSELKHFLSQNKIIKENVKYVPTDTFIQDGKPIEWEIRCLNTSEDEKIRLVCYKMAGLNKEKEFDYSLYFSKLAAESTVYPNLKDKELQDSYGVMGDVALLKEMLSPGEYVGYINKVQEVNGYLDYDSDLTKKAKN